MSKHNIITFILTTIMVSVIVFVGTSVYYNQRMDADKAVHEQQTQGIIKSVRTSTVLEIQNKNHEIQDIALRSGLVKVIMKIQPKVDEQIATKIAHHIVIESKLKNLNPMLVAAIIWAESEFDPFARSRKGAIGLMQIRYSTWKKDKALLKNGARKEGSLFWIDINIKSGTEIFAEYYGKADNNVIKALYRYYSGSPRLPKGKRSYEIPYVSKVLINVYKLQKMMNQKEENTKK